jgi:hypothetical protein
VLEPVAGETGWNKFVASDPEGRGKLRWPENEEDDTENMGSTGIWSKGRVSKCILNIYTEREIERCRNYSKRES